MPEPRHPHPFGPHGPYDPMRHHHHDHPPYMVDRCADQCDDQLPLLSQVGRGLQGFGYRVEVTKDNLTETELSGFLYDPHTGTVTKEWTSENVNGGHLYYAYNYRPWTVPKTFTITFKYVRPGRNAKPDGTVWSWVSPAIPYVWDEEDKNIGAGVATVYLKSTADGAWPTGRPTDAWLAKHEKLRYPDGMDHDSMNAPNPMEPYSVNLTFGIGGDIDVPSVDDIAKIIGVTPETIRNLVQGDLPTDTFPNGRNVKQYVDNLYNVRSTNEVLLKVTKNTSTAGKIEFVLEPTDQLANLEAGPGIKIAKVGGKYKVSAKLKAGSGINIREENGFVVIENTMAPDAWTNLIGARPGTPEAATADFLYTWRNGWYGGTDGGQTDRTPMVQPTIEQMTAPILKIIPTRDTNGNLIGATVRVTGESGHQFLNSKPLSIDSFAGTPSDPINFELRHAQSFIEVQKSVILTFMFANKYASLNNARIVSNEDAGSKLWGVRGTSDNWDSGTPEWTNVRAAWPVTCDLRRASDPFGNGFLLSAVNIGDGWNNQYLASNYGVSHLCIRSWANIDNRMILQIPQS